MFTHANLVVICVKLLTILTFTAESAHLCPHSKDGKRFDTGGVVGETARKVFFHVYAVCSIPGHPCRQHVTEYGHDCWCEPSIEHQLTEAWEDPLIVVRHVEWP